MKKILFYTSGIGIGGVERVILEILKLLPKEKYDIKLALQYENENFFENEIPKEVNYKYMLPLNIINRSLIYREKKKQNVLYKFLYSFNLVYERYVIKKNYLEFSKDRDIVIDFKSGDFLKLIVLNKNKKKFCWFHTEITKLGKFQKKRKKMIKELEKVDKVICVCNEMKKNVISEIPYLKNKIEVVYNPFNIDEIRKKSEKLGFIDKEKLERLNSKYIIMVARLELKMKDFFTLIEAFKRIDKKYNEIKLYFLGDGNDKDKIIEKIKRENLEERVILLGEDKNPYPWIKNSLGLIHSSKYEGFGLTLVEALILKKKIVATDCKVGPAEILNNGEYGFLTPVGDVEKLRENIEKMLSYSTEFEYDKAVLRFDSEEIIKKLNEVLE